VFVLCEVEDMEVSEGAQYLDATLVAAPGRRHCVRGLLREVLERELDLAERNLYEFGQAVRPLGAERDGASVGSV
jgi:RNA polymerase sigma-70 factor (ECF subfamily)